MTYNIFNEKMNTLKELDFLPDEILNIYYAIEKEEKESKSESKLKFLENNKKALIDFKENKVEKLIDKKKFLQESFKNFLFFILKDELSHELENKCLSIIKKVNESDKIFSELCPSTNESSFEEIRNQCENNFIRYPSIRSGLFLQQLLILYKKLLGSPIKLDKKIEVKTEDITTSIIPLQRIFRAQIRAKQHEEKFKKSIQKEITLNPYWQEFKKDLDLIVADGRKNVKHYTTMENLSSILSQGLMFGARNLVRNFIKYKAMTLHIGDILNLDDNVICFSKDQIDIRARRKASARIEIPIHHLFIPNAFCKIKDFGFNNWEERKIEKDGWFIGITGNNFIIRKDKQKFERELVFDSDFNKSDAMFYNLGKIDTFFASYIFYLLNPKDAPEELCKEFRKYLLSLNEKERRKFLREIGECLSYCNEVNVFGAFALDLFKAKISVRTPKPEPTELEDDYVEIDPNLILGLVGKSKKDIEKELIAQIEQKSNNSYSKWCNIL